jgi:predicted dehydrogenase
MTVVRIGVAGLGSVCHKGILPHLSQDDITDRIELTAVMDPVPGRAKAVAEQYGARLAFEDYDEMLRADIDAVVLASPIFVHHEQVMKAIEAGKHLQIQKTMTSTLAEANDVVEAVKSSGVVAVASPGQMQRPAHQMIKRFIDQGAIGKLYWATVGMAFKGHENEPIRRPGSVVTDINPLWYYRKGAGPMRDRGVYGLHTITGILGPAKRVTGMSGIGQKQRRYGGDVIDVEVHDNTVLTLDFGDSVFCTVYGMECSNAASPGYHFLGLRGGINMGRGELQLIGDPELFGVPRGRMSIPLDDRLPYATGVHHTISQKHIFSDIMHMVDCVLNGKEPVVTVEHARHVIEIIEKGYIAAETGQAQDLTTTFEVP